MRIAIHGRYFGKKKCNLLRDFSRWSCKKLLHNKLYKQIELNIQLINPDQFLKDETFGYCEVDEYAGPYARVFTIGITTKFNMMRTLSVLAHEMVHLKQYAVGELRHCNKTGNLRWNRSDIVDNGNIDYWDLPWEIEAHGREKGLVYQWATLRGYNKTANWYHKIF